MGGALLQLVALGSQDIPIVGIIVIAPPEASLVPCPSGLWTTNIPEPVVRLVKGGVNLIRVLEIASKPVAENKVLFPDKKSPVTEVKLSPLINPVVFSLNFNPVEIPDITGAG